MKRAAGTIAAPIFSKGIFGFPLGEIFADRPHCGDLIFEVAESHNQIGQLTVTAVNHLVVAARGDVSKMLCHSVAQLRGVIRQPERA